MFHLVPKFVTCSSIDRMELFDMDCLSLEHIQSISFLINSEIKKKFVDSREETQQTANAYQLELRGVYYS